VAGDASGRRILMLRLARGIVLVLCLAALVAASAAFAGKKLPTPPICDCYPIDAPVICSNGVTYLNQCVATCAGATDCVPTEGGGGGGPQP
jgi:hypothetical protein